MLRILDPDWEVRQTEWEAFVRSQPPTDAPPPPGCTIEQLDGGFQALVKLNSWHAIGAIFVAILWNSIMLVMVFGLGRKMPCCLPFLSLHIAVGLMVSWNAALLCFGTTFFRYDALAKTVSVSTGVGPIRWTRTRPLSQVRGVCRDTNKWLLKGKHQPPQPCLRLDADEPIRFAGIMTNEKREWLYAVTVAALRIATPIPPPSPQQDWWRNWT